jgi:hypothetical protein
MMKLNDTNKPKIALILTREGFDTYDVMKYMTEYYTLGVEPDNASLWQVRRGIREHLKNRVLRQKKYDGGYYDKFSADLEKLCLDFFDEVIDPWITSTYPKLWFWLKKEGDYSLEHVADFHDWLIAVADTAMSDIPDLSDMMFWGEDLS